jgi:uncharacterized membrane protein (DUF485 family)
MAAVLKPQVPEGELAERKRRSRRSAVLLGLVAAAFYVGFIVLTFFRSQHG